MLNTYIKNRGITKTIIHDNNHNYTNEINWDADYDGDIANISIETESNGKSKHFDIKLDNNDLANILNVHSVNMPIDKRLKMDFNEERYDNEPYFIELPTQNFQSREPIIEEPETSINELIDRHISSPKSNEIFLPLSIDNKKYTHTARKRHRRRKTHVTHKLIKRNKSNNSRSKYSRTKSKSRTSRRTLG